MTNQRSDDNNNPLLNSGIEYFSDEVKRSGIMNYRSTALPTWCPGCGYYGITHGLANALKNLHVNNNNLVIVSGIGCAGRYPFFVKGYGLHGIHGRALPIASGIKMVRPEFTVLAIGGDGDGLGIGGGHLPHAIRRNIDITYILFDNAIYGLTKGQASPTTPFGQYTKTTPYGNPEKPLNPILIGLAYGASFVAQGFAGFPQDLTIVFQEAIQHKGFSFVVVTTPCVTFDHANITYQRFRNIWKKIPEDHDKQNLANAMALAQDGNYYNGILFQDHRNAWHDVQQSIRKNTSITK
ncbi:2-oxoacid:ferredoxin oxidoreductase subunit beta [bacterium]|nr:2-oxoacid:ferredoxin oxidoreductase subunit beta [candidate division CSSED10-310 bacterium]